MSLLALFMLLGASIPAGDSPFVVVLGIGQDGGVPQLGNEASPIWQQESGRHTATSLALVDPASGQRWLFEATPDLREQMRLLHTIAPASDKALLDGIFLTHAHMGHYTGLMFLGHESLGAKLIPVHAMPRMADYLAGNGPWDQLVRYENIALREIRADVPVALTDTLNVTAFTVPHRQEYSEVVGYRIEGPHKSALFIPDIDSWDQWEAAGTSLETVLAGVDVAWLDATFFADGEIANRDMSGFPHPRIRQTMDRLADLPAVERAKVRFIHLNHTNPALLLESPEANEILERGFGLARPGDIVGL